MPAPSTEPLRRTTLNLFETDCKAMERRYGRGWTERVRELVREHVRKSKAERYVEDYENGQ